LHLYFEEKAELLKFGVNVSQFRRLMEQIKGFKYNQREVKTRKRDARELN